MKVIRFISFRFSLSHAEGKHSLMSCIPYDTLLRLSVPVTPITRRFSTGIVRPAGQ